MLITFFEKIEKKTGEEILHLENDLENLIPLNDINSELQNLVIFDDFIMSNNFYNWLHSRHCATVGLGHWAAGLPECGPIYCICYSIELYWLLCTYNIQIDLWVHIFSILKHYNIYTN